MQKERLIEVARNHGLDENYHLYPNKIIIRKIQQARGQTPCYLEEGRFTCNVNCEWSSGCKQLTAMWLR